MNTHREEKLRLAEAPDGALVWVNCLGDAWSLVGDVRWEGHCKYIVADGIHVEERKAFAEGKKIEARRADLAEQAFCLTLSPTWDERYEYRVVESEPLYETRWQMLKDHESYTTEIHNYYNQSHIDANYEKSDGWYKGKSIEVKIN